ncbi:MAG: NTP transferase domain-containing protein [Fidelibacterota bacterium]
MKTKLAVYLLAGRGTRLLDKTLTLPKCLIPINGVPLLIRSMNQVIEIGIEKVVLVIGYEGQQIIETFGDYWNGIEVTYIDNKDWHRTNNVVSLEMASHSIDGDFLLLEGDLIYGSRELKKLNMKRNSMAIAPMMPYMKGTTVSMKGDGSIDQFYMKSLGKEPDNVTPVWKTVNIYHFLKDEYLNTIQPELKELLKKGNKQCYYEQAFALAVGKRNIEFEACVFDNDHWYEIDTQEDLAISEKKFPPNPSSG